MGRQAPHNFADVKRQSRRCLIRTTWAASFLATAILVHTSTAEFIDKVTQHHYFTTVTLRARQGCEGNGLRINIFSMHLPSNVGHTEDQMDEALPAEMLGR